MPDAPIRLTRGRATALLEMFERGFDDERRELEAIYRVKISDELTVSPAGGDLDFFWETAEAETQLREAIENLQAARDAATIIRRRYLTQ